jgi:hypothetical protein
MAPARRHSYATADYDGDNPLRLAEKIDAALDKYGLGKRTPPVERELLATMTQQCRVRYQKETHLSRFAASIGSGQGALVLEGRRWRCRGRKAPDP